MKHITKSCLGGDIDYLSNNDAGRHVPCRLKQLTFEAAQLGQIPPPTLIKHCPLLFPLGDRYETVEELMEDWETFSTDVVGVCQEALDSGLSAAKVHQVLRGWARLAEREADEAIAAITPNLTVIAD